MNVIRLFILTGFRNASAMPARTSTKASKPFMNNPISRAMWMMSFEGGLFMRASSILYNSFLR